MNTDEAIDVLRGLRDEIPRVARAGRYSGAHQRWAQNCSFWLGRLFGPHSGVLSNFSRLNWSKTGSIVGVDPFEMEERVQREHRKAFKAQLEMAKGFLQSAIDQLEAVSLDQLREESGYLVRSDAKRVFITHGHAEDVLRRVEDFVRALGFEPVVVKRGASLGGATDDVVEERMAECDAQIVLATGDDSVNGSLQPRMNVVHEIGLGQGLFKNHMIYLKESGCEFPSNVSPKIWQTFTRDDMSPAFEKIAKELRAMGLL